MAWRFYTRTTAPRCNYYQCLVGERGRWEGVKVDNNEGRKDVDLNLASSSVLLLTESGGYRVSHHEEGPKLEFSPDASPISSPDQTGNMLHGYHNTVPRQSIVVEEARRYQGALRAAFIRCYPPNTDVKLPPSRQC
ncbi:hypothetical protein WAI453_011418 [Rhynchosporium graminicola]